MVFVYFLFCGTAVIGSSICGVPAQFKLLLVYCYVVFSVFVYFQFIFSLFLQGKSNKIIKKNMTSFVQRLLVMYIQYKKSTFSHLNMYIERNELVIQCYYQWYVLINRNHNFHKYMINYKATCQSVDHHKTGKVNITILY